MMSTTLSASVIVAAIGALLLWANPRRKVNRAIFACSAIVAAWLVCGHLATTQPIHGLFWLRLTYAVGGLAPLSLWMVKESIVGTFQARSQKWIHSNFVWFASAILLFSIPFSEMFIPSTSTEAERIRGIGHRLYYIGVVSLYAKLLYDSARMIKTLSGARRIELLWLLGGCIIAAVIYMLIALGGLTRDPLYRSLQPIAVLVFYAGTAYAITSHRIFDARQIVLVVAEKAILVLTASAMAFLIVSLLGLNLSKGHTFVITAAVVLATANLVRSRLDSKFQFFPKGGAARGAAFAIAQRETRLDRLEMEFRALLRGWGQTEQALILSGTKEVISGSGIQLECRGNVFNAMQTLRWASPERLVRERSNAGRQAVASFLKEHGLGLVVIEEGPAMNILIGVAPSASRRPYTYPEVLQLIELSAIMQAALERAHYSAKAQHAEQLAVVGVLGASLAHEIRNPLVSIKTFVQLLPNHYQDPRFREKFFRLISDEVGRIDQLTEQLLDLSAPRAYEAQQVGLNTLLKATLELVAAKASHGHVELLTDLGALPDQVFTDASAAKQVMINLCFNAIQAVEDCNVTERWVKVATRNVPMGVEMIVADSGPGISADIRAKLFQPFQTTKSTGFGLGLAICSDILTNLSASISVDPSEAGQGAVFRVVFPCRPSSS